MIGKLLMWWICVWFISTAIHPRLMRAFISPAQNLNAALMQPTSPCYLDHSYAMAPTRNFHCAPPLRTCCSLVDAEPCSRTSLGKRCFLNCCVNLSLGIHISFSPYCNHSRSPSNFFGTPLQAASRPLSTDSSALFALQIMPRLRQRMSCRRGSSRGHVNHRPSFSSSASSSDSSDTGLGRVPTPRRG